MCKHDGIQWPRPTATKQFPNKRVTAKNTHKLFLLWLVKLLFVFLFWFMTAITKTKFALVGHLKKTKK